MLAPCRQEISQAKQASQQAKQEAAKLSEAADKLWEKPALKGDFYDSDRPWTAPSNEIDEGEAVCPTSSQHALQALTLCHESVY